MERIILKNIELERLSTDTAVKRRLVPIGEPTVAKNSFELTGLGGDCVVQISPEYVPRDAVAYSIGNPAVENAKKGGLNAYVPVQFFRKGK